jgi:hypothetical protein
MMFSMCPIPIDPRYGDYVPAMGRACAGPGLALHPVLSNLVACENLVTRAAEGVSNITCR